MTLYKKVIIGIAIIITLLLLTNLGINFWINEKLPKIISRENNPYHITYKKLDVSLWSGNIDATDIIMVPKSSLKDTLRKEGIYSKIESIQIKKFKIWDVLFNDKIKARSLIINKPEVVLYKKDEKPINDTKKIRSEIVDPLQKMIVVSDIYLNHGRLKIIYVKNNKPIASVENVNAQVEGIIITEETLKNKIPFQYQNYTFSCDDIYFRVNKFYHLKAAKIQKEETGFRVIKGALLPEYTRQQFVKRLTKEKDLYTLQTDSIRIKKIDWGFKNDQFYFKANALILDRLSATIYRSKMPHDDLSKKHLYNKLLRELPFPLKIDTLSIRNSKVVYEEELNFEKGPGVLTFDKFNLRATHIESGFGQKKLADLKIKINCRFMKTSPVKVNWTLNVLDKSDGFNIRGSIFNFDTNKLYPFVKPYMNATVQGIFDEIHFNFYGNDKVSKGDLALKYHDLKVTLYKKKKPEKKNKLKSFIANLLVKNDSKDKTKNVSVEVERIPEKSFYNFLWRSISEGLKKIII